MNTRNKKIKKTTISLVDYGKAEYVEKIITEAKQCLPYKDDDTITWINIDGLNDIKIIEELGDYFGFHPLTLEDVLSTRQRPKLEDFSNYIYVVLKMLDFDEDIEKLTIEQVSIIFGKNYLISFQENALDIYNHIRVKLKDPESKVRKEGTDFLAYLLIDSIIDNYFKVLEQIGEKIEKVENRLVLNPSQKKLGDINKLKRHVLYIRKSIWPLREVVSIMGREQIPLVKKSTRLYVRDVYDHVIRIIDTVETYREVLSEMIDIYLSSMSNKLNEIMKVLTIFASIFIPLTFIASIYGMNFKYMPEIQWQWGYLFAWIAMIGVGVFLVIYFKIKKWF